MLSKKVTCSKCQRFIGFIQFDNHENVISLPAVPVNCSCGRDNCPVIAKFERLVPGSTKIPAPQG